MKKIILTIMLMAAVTIPVFSQTVFSNGTGGGVWSYGSTWIGGVVPIASTDVIIAGTDSVSTTAGAVCANLTVLSGGILATGIDSISVSGTFILEADAYFHNSSTKSTVPGTVRELDPASTVIHMGSGTVGSPENNVFGNLIIKRLEGCVPGANLTINGNLIINNAAANVVFRGVRPATGSQTHTVLGDLIINMGTVSCIDVGDNAFVGIWNIGGDVIINGVDARFSCFSSANAAGLAIYNIEGDIINNGGRIQGGTSSSAGPGISIVNLKGDFIFNSGQFATNTLGAYALNFTKNGVQNFFLRGVNVNLNTNLHDTIKAGSTVVMDLDTNKWGSSTGGEFVVDGALELKSISRLTGSGNFTLNANATLKVGSPEGITLSSMLGNVQMIGTRNYSADAIYIYNGTTQQVFGDGLPVTLKELQISNSNGFSLETDVTVTSLLKLNSGGLNLNGHTITLGADATLSEAAGSTVMGVSGKIMTTRTLNAPSLVNVGGLGAVLTTNADLGVTTIERYHKARNGNGNSGVLRAYNIQPANNTGLNATLRFHYDESELNGIAEANLFVFRSPNGEDNTWSSLGGYVNVSENFVETTGVGEFAYLTASGSNNPLPVEEETSSIPSEFVVYQNYPNPFNPSTSIRFALPAASLVKLSVYNMLGQKIGDVIDGMVEAGMHSVNFDAGKLSAGIYVYRLTTGNKVFSYKMNLLK